MTVGSRAGRFARGTRVLLAAVLAAVPVWVAVGAGEQASAGEPVVTAIEPATVPVEGGTVVVHGTGFTPGHTLVWWDGVELVPVDITSTLVEVVVPPHEPGEVEVRVQVGEGFSEVLVHRYAEPVTPGAEDPEPLPTAPAAAEPPVDDPPADDPVDDDPVDQREDEPRVPDAVPAAPDRTPPTELAETGGSPRLLLLAVVLLLVGVAAVRCSTARK